MQTNIDTGFINAYNDFKGFGFIRRNKGKDVFFSIDDFNGEIKNIVIGLSITFEVVSKTKGPRAYNIRVTPEK
uniref:Cold shock-like protein CspLA n=1 Tax=Aliivibrio wodanis TaxID=80852 RepID=A0A5Q4ZQJ9_9GAMM|nr:Cold shock-like protein CspLA [Aliivibrio wodanis]